LFEHLNKLFVLFDLLSELDVFLLSYSLHLVELLLLLRQFPLILHLQCLIGQLNFLVLPLVNSLRILAQNDLPVPPFRVSLAYELLGEPVPAGALAESPHLRLEALPLEPAQLGEVHVVLVGARLKQVVGGSRALVPLVAPEHEVYPPVQLPRGVIRLERFPLELQELRDRGGPGRQHDVAHRLLVVIKA
jgi:hypothetical protein